MSLNTRLHISEQQDAAILADFYCGESHMDEFLHKRLNAFLASYDCRFYVIKDDAGQIIAMFVLRNGRIYLDEDCKDDLQMKFPDILEEQDIANFWESGVFPSIEIEYLAVQQEVRKNHVGSDIIEFVSSLRNDTYFRNPIFISVSAYCTQQYTAVPFYSKNGFWASEIKNPNADTLKMYRMI